MTIEFEIAQPDLNVYELKVEISDNRLGSKIVKAHILDETEDVILNYFEEVCRKIWPPQYPGTFYMLIKIKRVSAGVNEIVRTYKKNA